MSYFVYVLEAETGRAVRFGSYDVPPFIIAKDGTKFIDIPAFTPQMLKAES